MSGAVLLQDKWVPVPEHDHVWRHEVQLQPNPIPTHGKGVTCLERVMHFEVVTQQNV
jgi:hypothetical protein